MVLGGHEIVDGFFRHYFFLRNVKNIYRRRNTRFTDNDGRRSRCIVHACIVVRNIITHARTRVYIYNTKKKRWRGRRGLHASRAWRDDYLVPSSPVTRIYIYMYRPWATLEKLSAQTDTVGSAAAAKANGMRRRRTRTGEDKRNTEDNTHAGYYIVNADCESDEDSRRTRQFKYTIYSLRNEPPRVCINFHTYIHGYTCATL